MVLLQNPDSYRFPQFAGQRVRAASTTVELRRPATGPSRADDVRHTHVCQCEMRHLPWGCLSYKVGPVHGRIIEIISHARKDRIHLSMTSRKEPVGRL